MDEATTATAGAHLAVPAPPEAPCPQPAAVFIDLHLGQQAFDHRHEPMEAHQPANSCSSELAWLPVPDSWAASAAIVCDDA